MAQETFRTVKLEKDGRIFELVEGDAYDSHIAVNWFEGIYEIVKEATPEDRS